MNCLPWFWPSYAFPRLKAWLSFWNIPSIKNMGGSYLNTTASKTFTDLQIEIQSPSFQNLWRCLQPLSCIYHFVPGNTVVSIGITWCFWTRRISLTPKFEIWSASKSKKIEHWFNATSGKSQTMRLCFVHNITKNIVYNYLQVSV